MRRLATLGALALALVAWGCKEADPDYCPDAGKYHFSCAEQRDAGVTDAKPDGGDAHDAADARDAAEAGDAADAHDAADGPVDLPIEPKPVCAMDDDCPADAGKLACDTSGAAPKCVECTDSAKHCKDPARPACDTKAQKCVECVDDTKCGDAKPVCDVATNTCRTCAADAECKAAPGICVDFDGHCAKPTEVVTLQGGAACTPAGLLFCKASLASAAITAATPILLVKGPDPVGEIDPPGGVTPKVLIVGKADAVVGAGSGDGAGVHLAGATEYWVRDLTVSGGTAGIVVDSAKLAHINRCVVTGNGKGGIKTVDSGFDITNTIVANNMAGTDTGGVGFGGVRLGDVPTGGVARFDNNTVVDNKQVGVSCKAPTYDTSTSILHNNVGGDSINCAGTLCCGAGDPDPMLDASYHVRAGSPCVDKITATSMSVSVDIQGQARPLPPAGKLDCGADELVP